MMNQNTYPNTKSQHSVSTGVLIAMGLIGIALICADVFLAFTVAPLVKGAALTAPVTLGEVTVTHKLLLSQKIFYLHVPVAISSFVMMGVMAFHGLRYLKDAKPQHDCCSHAAAHVALLMVSATMASGVLWTRFEWGVWWVWEPRLTTYAILTLMLIAYAVLRTALPDAHKRSVFCAAFSIIAFVNAPISFAITRLVPTSIHPVVLRSDAQLPATMLIPFILGLIGMLCLSCVLYHLTRMLMDTQTRLGRVVSEVELRASASTSSY